MNLKERFIVFALSVFDRFMDWATYGLWTRVRGEVVPCIKVKE